MVDVMVIGAGFAGVTAARELKAAGYMPLILEASARLGGRTYRAEHAGKTFELGGAYVHWLQPHIWAELTRYGLRIVPGDGGEVSEIRLWSEGQLHTFDLETGYSLLSEAYGALYAVGPQPAEVLPFPYDPLTHTEWLQHAEFRLSDHVARVALPQPQRDLLGAMLASDMSASAGDAALIEMLRLRALLGTDDFSKLADVTGTYMIDGGTSALLDKILSDSGADVQRNQLVTAVRQTGTSVNIHTVDGSHYQAAAVVLATPLNTWANLTFEPALSETKRTVSQQRHAGAGVKCFIRVVGKVPELLGLAPEPHPISLLTPYASTEDGAWLVAFGPNALELFSVEWAQAAVEPLLPGVQVQEVFGHNWTQDPLSLGTWADFKVGQAQYLGALIAPEGRVVFAGADIALGWRGYIDGAIESGLRAARQMTHILNTELALSGQKPQE